MMCACIYPVKKKITYWTIYCSRAAFEGDTKAPCWAVNFIHKYENGAPHPIVVFGSHKWSLRRATWKGLHFITATL